MARGVPRREHRISSPSARASRPCSKRRRCSAVVASAAASSPWASERQALATSSRSIARVDDGSSLGRDIVRPLFGELHDRVMGELDAITLDDLCRQAQAAGIIREDDPMEADYAI